MTAGHGGHDFRLLDALEEIKGIGFAGNIWRVVRSQRSVFDGSRGSGRWNPSDLEVLYAAQEADGALAEIHFHLSLGQRIFPTRIQHTLYQLSVKMGQTLHLVDMDALIALGVEPSRYGEMLYHRTQEIADAAAFLGFDGLIAPSARWTCQNLVLFLDSFNIEDLDIISEEDVNWAEWIARNRTPS